MRTLASCLLFLLLPALSACACPRRCCPATAQPSPKAASQRATPAPTPATAPRMAWYAGNGTPLTKAQVEAAAAEADVVAFGELHGVAEGAQAEMALLRSLARGKRPVALAMEFFERDTQAALDAYMRGESTEEEFVKATRQGKDYARTHGPLVAFCKQQGIPVIAANAPRRLVRAYRQTSSDYETFLEEQSEEDRGFLPRETHVLEDAYQEKFMALMGKERGPSFFRSQSLWDDAMAEAVADFREDHPEHRVFLIVGGFHVTQGLGTLTKYRMRRGKDETRIVLMSPTSGAEPSFSKEDTGQADVILKVVMRPAAPSAAPTAAPASAPKGPPPSP